jgi:hypothetical protein
MAIEARRGCGFRKVGGFYLVAPKSGTNCHRFPIPLHVCPTCNQGIKQARGWTWVSKKLFQPDCAARHNESVQPGMGGIDGMDHDACAQGLRHMLTCPACNTGLLPDKVGLIWIGERFYKTPKDFMQEAAHQGLSRRVKKIPRNFKIGESWVFCAHPKAIVMNSTDPSENGHGQLAMVSTKYIPGVITAFKPERVETLMFKKDITKKKREEFEKKGITLVEVPTGDMDHAGSVYDKEAGDDE